ncbi:MAG: hypothetical protein M1833_006676 [Piccolia ochrophora]|nr:MAG: hypothetical protein M1833_006676 [Piccolia ochrophora]
MAFPMNRSSSLHLVFTMNLSLSSSLLLLALTSFPFLVSPVEMMIRWTDETASVNERGEMVWRPNVHQRAWHKPVPGKCYTDDPELHVFDDAVVRDAFAKKYFVRFWFNENVALGGSPCSGEILESGERGGYWAKTGGVTGVQFIDRQRNAPQDLWNHAGGDVALWRSWMDAFGLQEISARGLESSEEPPESRADS